MFFRYYSLIHSFTLTTGTDSGAAFTGGAGNDTFDASFNSSGRQTLNGLDSINGGAGTDTLIAELSASVTPTSLAGIEAVRVSATHAATLDLVNAPDLTTVTNQSSTDTLTLSGVSTAVGVTIADTADAQIINYRAVTGSADAATITLDTMTGAADLTVADIETVTLNATGAASSVDLIATAATTLNVTGSAALTVSELGAAGQSTAVTRVDASAHTGGLTLTTGALGTAATHVTVVGGTGNDTLTVSGVTNRVNVNGGAGNDTIDVGGNLVGGTSTPDTINGGDGTDTLVVTNAASVGYTVQTTPTVSSIETLRISDAASGTHNTGDIATSITTVVFGADATSATVNFQAGTNEVQIGRSSTTDVNLVTALTVDAAGSATNDTLTISNRNGSTQDAFNGANITTTDFETVTINSGTYTTGVQQTIGTISVTGSAGGTSAETVVFAGANAVSAGAISADIIDASGLGVAASGATFDMADSGNTATTITGSAGNDDLRSNASTASSIVGGAGNDTITGGSGNDNLSGGDGVDGITSGSGSDTVLGGAGNDGLTFGDNLGSGDSVDGGDGTDTLSITDASLETLAGLSISAVGTLNGRISVERVTISNDLNRGTFDMGRLDDINYITLATGIDGNETLSGLAADTTIRLQGAGSDTLTAALASATGSADSLNLVTEASANRAFDNLTISSIETLTVTGQEGTASSTVYQHSLNLTETGLTTLNIAGTEKMDLDGAAISVTTVTVTSTGGAAVDNSAAGVDTTFTGGSGADEYTGAAGNDTISAGGGADYVFGGIGADSITGGNGSDIIVGGAGNDAIILTEDTPSTDYVAVVNQTAATNVDTLTGFTRGSSSGFDVLDLDSALLNTTAANVVISTSAAASALTSAHVRLETAAGTMNTEMGGVSNDATDRVMVLNSQAYSSATLAEIAAGTLGAATNTINAAGYVVWTDGTDIYVSSDSDLDTSGTTMFHVAKFAGGLTELRELSLSNFSTGMLRGGEFDDNLTGLASFADIIIGGAGNDTIAGGSGADTMTGGAGADRFVFNVASAATPTADSTASALDTITDFTVGTDSVALADTDGTAITIALDANDVSGTVTAAAVDVLNTSGVLTGITVGDGTVATAYTIGTGGSSATNTVGKVAAILNTEFSTDGTVILFDFDSDMYLWMQNGAADLLVRFVGLQGVTALTDTADVFTFA